jgi:hypothetical protein
MISVIRILATSLAFSVLQGKLIPIPKMCPLALAAIELVPPPPPPHRHTHMGKIQLPTHQGKSLTSVSLGPGGTCYWDLFSGVFHMVALSTEPCL